MLKFSNWRSCMRSCECRSNGSAVKTPYNIVGSATISDLIWFDLPIFGSSNLSRIMNFNGTLMWQRYFNESGGAWKRERKGQGIVKIFQKTWWFQFFKCFRVDPKKIWGSKTEIKQNVINSRTWGLFWNSPPQLCSNGAQHEPSGQWWTALCPSTLTRLMRPFPSAKSRGFPGPLKIASYIRSWFWFKQSGRHRAQQSELAGNRQRTPKCTWAQSAIIGNGPVGQKPSWI